MRILFGLLIATLISGCSSSDKTAKSSEAAAGQSASAQKPLPETLEEAAASEFRAPESRARDVYRNPVETLTFFGLRPDMTVVEISPGTGWYSQILAPYLVKEGKFYAAVPTAGSDYLKKMNETYSNWLKSHPELESKVTITPFDLPNDAAIAPECSADMVLTFRNVHNWMARGTEDAAFEAFFKALKPGGILGVVEHRGDPGKKQDPKAKSGYVREKDVIRMAEKAGFKLADKSEINANPKDTKDYPDGVWTLPPSLRLKEKDRDRFMAIGESDRMTLKFIKPAK